MFDSNIINNCWTKFGSNCARRALDMRLSSCACVWLMYNFVPCLHFLLSPWIHNCSPKKKKRSDYPWHHASQWTQEWVESHLFVLCDLKRVRMVIQYNQHYSAATKTKNSHAHTQTNIVFLLVIIICILSFLLLWRSWLSVFECLGIYI